MGRVFSSHSDSSCSSARQKEGKRKEEEGEEGGKKGEEEGGSKEMTGSIAMGPKSTQIESWCRQVRPVVPEPLSAMIGG